MSRQTYIDKIMKARPPEVDGFSNQEAITHLKKLSAAELKLALADVISYQPPAQEQATSTLR